MRQLQRAPLLDHNLAARAYLCVDGGEGRRHEEGHVVMGGNHREGVGPNLVGRVACMPREARMEGR